MNTQFPQTRSSFCAIINQQLKTLTVAGCAVAGILSASAQSLSWDPGQTGGSSGPSGGGGTWSLNGAANWWNGSADAPWTDNSSTGVNGAVFGGSAGTVTLNTTVSATNLLFDTTGYMLSGSGTLMLGWGGINCSALTSGNTTIGVALSVASSQQSWQADSGGTLAVNGNITRSTGATVDFATNGVSTSTGVTSSSLTAVNGVIGGWATVGGVSSGAGDWAAISGGSISVYGGYTSVSTTGGSSQSGSHPTQNWNCGDPTGVNNYVTTLTASTTLNSLVQQGDVVLNNGVTLTLEDGGLILRGPSRWMILSTGNTGYLTSGASTGELFVHTPNPGSGGNWTLWPIIANNSSTPVTLVKDGVDIVKLGNMNTYTGGTIVNNGILAYTGNAEYGIGSSQTGAVTPFGTGPVTLNSGTQIQLGVNVGGNNFSEFDIPNNVTLNNAALYEYDGFFRVKGNLTVGSGGGSLGSTFSSTGDPVINGFGKGLCIDGLVTGTGNLSILDPDLYGANGANWNGSVVYFTSMGTAAQNTYSGTITVTPWSQNAGCYLYVIGTQVLANATINLTGDNAGGNNRFGTPTLVFGSGTNGPGAGMTTLGALEGSGDFILNETWAYSGGQGYSIGGPVALTVGYNNASTLYSAVMSGSGSLTKAGTGTLTLSGANTYTGNTTIAAGKLALTGAWLTSATNTVDGGATLDVSAISPVNLSGSQVLRSSGTINGSVNTSSGTAIYADSGTPYGNNNITGSLTLAAGAVAYFSVSTSASGPNDQITVGGALTANNNVIHVKAPSTSVSLQNADYTLITAAGGVSGSFASAPSWDVAPANAANFSIVASGNTVKLHYTSCSGPSGSGTALPSPAVRNQSVTVTVNAVNGSCGTINSATLNASSIGGSGNIALANSGGNVWTVHVPIAPTTPAGAYTLPVTLTDTASYNGIVNVALTVAAANDVWNGAGPDNNFDDNSNWANGTAPGYAGDSLEFGGTTRLTPNLDNNYTVSSVTFDASAGSFNIGTANSSTLTLSGAGSLVDNSANPQTLNVPIGDAGGGLTMSGCGTLTLAANNTFTGSPVVNSGTLALAGNNVYTAPTVVNAGTLDISGPTASTANATVGNTAGNAVMNISGSGTFSPYYLLLGNVNNSVSALYQSGGTITATANSGYDNLAVGNVGGSFGYVNASGGSLTSSGICVGGEDNAGTSANFAGNGGNGLFEVNGGTVTDTGWLVASRNANPQIAVVNIYSGSLTWAGGGFVNNWGSGQTTIINVLGGTLATSSDNEIGFLGGTGIVNLLGGVTTVSAINGAWTGTGGQINFNGGTVQTVLNNDLGDNGNFLNVESARIYSGGGTIDNNGQSITVSVPLNAPSGNGIYGATIANAGAGYICPPIVTISPGAGDTTGAGATAIATVSGGRVTQITITSPGQNYTTTPTFTLRGGGATTPAVINGVAPTANISGGLTSIGSGSLTLTAVNTYAGATLIDGTLYLTGSGSINNSTNIVTDANGVFDVSSVSFTLGANQAMSGLGVVNGPVAAAAGSKIAGGYNGTYGTLTFNNNLTLASGAVCSLALTTSASGVDDQIVVLGTLTANNNVIHLAAPSTSSSLDTANYTLIIAPNGITGSFAAAPVWDVAPANAAHYSIVTSGTAVTLQYNATAASPTVTASANPSALLRNQRTVITANVTPGNAAIASVTVDLSSLGGGIVALVQSNSTSIYTNTVTVPAAAAPGSASVTVTATDTLSQSGSYSVMLTINTSNEVWNGGAGGNANWSANANWASGYAPGTTGDSITFGGTTDLSPNMDSSYSVNGLAFSGTAGAFTIGSTVSGTLTIANGSLVNNSTATETLNVAVGDGGAGITKTGTGAVLLNNANNTYTGPLTVNAGALTLAGSAPSTQTIKVGSAAGNAVLNLTGSATVSPYYFLLGNVSNANAAVYQKSGVVNDTVASGYDNLAIGNVAGAYGYYSVASGATLNANGICVGGENNLGGGASFGLQGGNGILEVNGGTVNDSGWFIIARQNSGTPAPSIGILNVYSGLVTYAGGGLIGPWDTNELAQINVMGGEVTNTASVGVGLGAPGFEGVLNLDGGELSASGVAGYFGPGYYGDAAGLLNFNGGTLHASGSSDNFIQVTTANIYSGGATIDNGDTNVVINQPLLAPAGNGIYGAIIANPGAGYIAPPILTISGGGGSGATAIAQINPVNGAVTNVIITCPGVNYTGTATITVTGGGATTPAVINAESPTANTSGDFTSKGSGTTTLSGANTYTGNTTVSAGTLEVVNPVLAESGTVKIAGGAVLQLDFAGQDTVAGLVLNGVTQPPGTYNNANEPTYITGPGSLVVPAPGPGRFTVAPRLTALSVANTTNVVINASNGQANNAYYLLTSTNVELPINQWRTIATNVLSASGSFTFVGTNAVTPGDRQQFYMLSNTNFNH